MPTTLNNYELILQDIQYLARQLLQGIINKFGVQLSFCSESDERCRTLEEKNMFFKGAYAEVYIKNNNINLNQINAPIESYLLGPFLSFFQGLNFQNQKYYIQKNELTLEDSLLFYINSPGTVNAITIDVPVIETYDYSTNSLDISFQMNPVLKQYRRKVFNILELTGTLGGIFEIFEILFGLTIGVFSSYKFKSELKGDIQKANKQYLELKKMFDELKKQVKHDNNQVNYYISPREGNKEHLFNKNNQEVEIENSEEDKHEYEGGNQNSDESDISKTKFVTLSQFEANLD